MNSEALVAAFKATTYRIETDEGVFDLRIGVKNSAFDDFLCRRKVSCWGVVTAFNPGAVTCDADNQQRHIHLREKLQTLGGTFLSANNVADGGAWPDETSFLVMQASEAEMAKLASEFSQLAFVWGNTGAEPRLVWI